MPCGTAKKKKQNRKENQAETLMGLCPVAVGKPAVFRNRESGEVSAVSSLPPGCGLLRAAICASPLKVFLIKQRRLVSVLSLSLNIDPFNFTVTLTYNSKFFHSKI